MKVIQGLLTDKFLTGNYVVDGCTVAAVVFLLALNSYRVIITNKYCDKNVCLQFHPPIIVRPMNLMSIIHDQI